MNICLYFYTVYHKKEAPARLFFDFSSPRKKNKPQRGKFENFVDKRIRLCYNGMRIKGRDVPAAAHGRPLSIRKSPAAAGLWAKSSGAGYSIFSRIWASSFFSLRETCTCVIPSACAVSVCVRCL